MVPDKRANFNFFDPGRVDQARRSALSLAGLYPSITDNELVKLEDDVFVGLTIADIQAVQASQNALLEPQPFTIMKDEFVAGHYTYLLDGVALNDPVNDSTFRLPIHYAQVAACLLGENTTNRSITKRLGYTPGILSRLIGNLGRKMALPPIPEAPEVLKTQIAVTSLRTGLLKYVK